MTKPQFVKPEFISMKNHGDFNERWVQEQIAKEPSILGLGDLELRDFERSQPHAGRLDLLLQDPETLRRYELELQLGDTDPGHIIRTLEYWDIERRRYPQYDHCAIIVAENITSRFLNVISLFNGAIPIIAIQVRALKIGDQITLVFTTVLGELVRGLVDQDENEPISTNRDFWEKRSSPATMMVADEVLTLIKSFSPTAEWRYKKAHIGLTENGVVNNFAFCTANRTKLVLCFHLDQTPEVTSELETAGLDTMTYDPGYKAYRIRLNSSDVQNHRALLTKMLSSAREHYAS